MGDDGEFSAGDFEGIVPEIEGKPRGSSSSTEEMARQQALSEPKRDPNDIRELYGLPRLDPDQIPAWLEAAA
jgi:hypothetical protein